MAESNLIEELQLEVTCSFCSQYTKGPVTLDCGHSYCQACISQLWARVEEEEEPKQCPLCRQSFRKRSFCQNKQLANVVGIVQRFPPPAVGLRQPQPQDQDQDVRSRSSALCGVESLGQDPQRHQESFRQRLEILKKDLQFVLSLPCDGEMREHHMISAHSSLPLSVKTYPKNPLSTLHDLHHFLSDRQQMILLKQQELEEKNGTKEEGQERKERRERGKKERKEEPGREQQNENITRGSQGTGRDKKSFFLQMFEHSESPQRKALWSGSKKPLKPDPQSPEPCDWRLPRLDRDQRIQMKSYTVMVTLDPKTANPELVLSSDLKSVCLGDKRKDMPNCHERFDNETCILASDGFLSGRCYWEVEVGDNDCWAVGVARGSVRRKGQLTFAPEHGFWTVEMYMSKYWALRTCPTRVYCSKRLRRVGIYVDYVEGLVAFHNAKTMDHLYTFTASFTEKIFPFFYTKDKKTPLVINGSNRIDTA